MADPPRHQSDRDDSDDSGAGPDLRSPPRMPRWVKVTAIVVGILVLLLVVARLTGVGGQHGPGRHGPQGGALPAGLTDVHPPPPADLPG